MDQPTMTPGADKPGAPALRLDVIAGLTAAAVVLPKAMAYATVAGLPVAVGLYTAFVPMLYPVPVLGFKAGIGPEQCPAQIGRPGGNQLAVASGLTFSTRDGRPGVDGTAVPCGPGRLSSQTAVNRADPAGGVPRHSQGAHDGVPLGGGRLRGRAGVRDAQGHRGGNRRVDDQPREPDRPSAHLSHRSQARRRRAPAAVPRAPGRRDVRRAADPAARGAPLLRQRATRGQSDPRARRAVPAACHGAGHEPRARSRGTRRCRCSWRASGA